MKLMILVLAMISTSVFAGNQLPMEAMRVLGSLRGNFFPSNCIEKNIKNGVEQKAVACSSDLVQTFYSHIDGIFHVYFFNDAQAQNPKLVYGRMVNVSQLGCRDVEGINSKECFDVRPGFFAQDVDYSFPIVCGNEQLVNTHKVHWEVKKTDAGLHMVVSENVFYNICKENGEWDAPMALTKDLSVELNKL